MQRVLSYLKTTCNHTSKEQNAPGKCPTDTDFAEDIVLTTSFKLNNYCTQFYYNVTQLAATKTKYIVFSIDKPCMQTTSGEKKEYAFIYIYIGACIANCENDYNNHDGKKHGQPAIYQETYGSQVN